MTIVGRALPVLEMDTGKVKDDKISGKPFGLMLVALGNLRGISKASDRKQSVSKKSCLR